MILSPGMNTSPIADHCVAATNQTGPASKSKRRPAGTLMVVAGARMSPFEFVTGPAWSCDRRPRWRGA
jgi:hypothetical protein